MDFLTFFVNVFIFIFGLCIGSFLNCVIYRLEQKKTLKGRSICPVCKSKLLWRDLIPVFSFLFLGRKCRYCRKSISWQYPIVELTTGILFLIIFNLSTQPFIVELSLNNYLQTSISVINFLNLAFLFYITAALVAIFFYDLNYYIIPDKILFPAIIIAFLYRLFENLIIENWILNSNFKFQISNFSAVSDYLFAAVIASGFFLAIFFVSRGRWMGFGDVKLAVLMGLLLGFPNILAALFLAFLFGAVTGTALMIFKGKNLRSEVPFAPFLIAGTFIALFWGSEVINWYLSATFFI